MSFNINAVLKDMTLAVKGVVKDSVGTMEVYGKDIFAKEKESLASLAEAKIAGEITEDEFKNELKREKKVLEAELLTVEIMTKAMAQKAINAAIDVLIKAINAAIAI